MAARIQTDFGLEAEIVAGHRGEFTVWVNNLKVAEKTSSGFPTDERIIEAIRGQLPPG